MPWTPPQPWQEKLAQDRESLEYKLERIIVRTTDQIVERMDELGVSRTELAERMDVNKAMVSKILNGYENMTLKTLVKIASGLDCELSVALPPCGYETRYFYVPQAKTRLSKETKSPKVYFSTSAQVRVEAGKVTPKDDIGMVA